MVRHISNGRSDFLTRMKSLLLIILNISLMYFYEKSLFSKQMWANIDATELRMNGKSVA